MAVDPYVQEWVAATNGRLYIPLINKLRRYPVPHCPLPQAMGQLLLDIGCGWGRWMLSAACKGYLPIGVDVKLDALQAARRVMRAHNIDGYVVAADLKKIPFKSRVFDVVFSYSVIQHTHRQRAYSCIEEVHRVLKDGGFCMLQFPTKYGMGNFPRRIFRDSDEEDNYDSWCVRYYPIGEVEALFRRVFGNFSYQPDCYFGLGLQRSDIDLVPRRYRPVVACSEALKGAARVFPLVKRLADSIYVLARKNVGSDPCFCTDTLLRLRHNSDQSKESNLAVLDLVACPATGCDLCFDAEHQELISKEAGLAYPVIDGIPVLLLDQARVL